MIQTWSQSQGPRFEKLWVACQHRQTGIKGCGMSRPRLWKAPASISAWSDRCAYRDTAEVSTYVDSAFSGSSVITLMRKIARPVPFALFSTTLI
jgi:hypothetical protein